MKICTSQKDLNLEKLNAVLKSLELPSFSVSFQFIKIAYWYIIYYIKIYWNDFSMRNTMLPWRQIQNPIHILQLCYIFFAFSLALNCSATSWHFFLANETVVC